MPDEKTDSKPIPMPDEKTDSKPIPEVVLFSIYGRTQFALVVSGRYGEVSHLGAYGEPLLTLAVLKKPGPNAPHKRPTPLQAAITEPEVEIHRDVVHRSHEFSTDFKREKKLTTAAQITSLRGPGEWRMPSFDAQAPEAATGMADTPAAPAPEAATGMADTPAAPAPVSFP